MLTTIDTSAVSMTMGVRPHDVILDPSGDSAYVTFVGESGPSDILVKYSTSTFLEIDRTTLAAGSHLAASSANGNLYVAEQGDGEVRVLSRATLDEVTTITGVPSSHGATMSPDGAYFYTTNIGGGDDAIFVIDTATNTVVGDLTGVDAPFPTAHNLVTTGDGTKLFVTHSGGMANQVSIYDLSDPTLPVYLTSTTVGTNPFGLAWIAPVPEPASIALLSLGGLACLGRRRR